MLAGLAFGGAAATASAAEWPQWRGPNRDAISKETGLLAEWPDDGPPLAWTAQGIGEGYSAPSVAGGRIYLMGQDASATYVRALDAKGGKILWSAKVGKPGGEYPGPRATPTVDGDRVYAIGQFSDLVCLSAKDGKEVWRKNLLNDFKGKLMEPPVWGFAESPLVDGEQLVCTPGGPEGTLAALDKATGKPLWRSKEFTDATAYASLVPAEIGGTRTYIVLTDKSVAGIDAKSGGVLWRAERAGSTAVIPTPVYADNHVFVTSGYGAGGDLFKVTPADGKFTVERVYHTDDLGVHIGGVVLVGKHLYGVNERQLLCVEFLTGKTLWKDRSVGKGAVVYADGHLYVRSDATPGEIALVEANPKEYVERGRLEQPDGSGKNTWPPPVIADAKMYLRDQDTLYCYDIKAK